MWPSNFMDDLEKLIGHLFCTTSSFVHHFKPIGELKRQLQSRNTQFGQKFLSCVTLKFDGWQTIGHLFHATSRFEHHLAICEFEL